MSRAKLTYIGEYQERNGKKFREIGAEEFNGERKSAWKCAPNFDRFKVGDVVDVLLSDNGKYINAVKAGDAANPTGDSGGKGYSKGTYSRTPDPEKDIAIYTRYCLDTILQKGAATPKEALDLVFGIKALVKERL